MKYTKLLFTTAAACLAVIPATAQAATLLFELSGGRNVTFTLDSNPTPTSGQSFIGSEQAVFSNLPGTVNGTPTTLGTVSFGTDVFADLSITAPALGFTQFASGGPLFTGTGAMPVFAPGTFTLVNPFQPESNSTLRISAVAPAVPEPATWAMMILGFGLTGFAVRRRQAGQRQAQFA